jgi:hypothetical protein
VKPEQLRAFWAARQGMGAAMAGAAPADVLARTGWVRSVGGCNPYLALRDRAGTSREAADAAVAALAIHELPSARGCTYVVPAQDFAIALAASRGHGDDSAVATAKKFLGVKEAEVDELCDRVLDAVAKEPLDPAGIKEAVGGAVRSLGAEGKKRGVTTTLPLALGRLQTSGRIRRVPVGGRLDQQRYRYVAWKPSPASKRAPSDEEIAVELARRYFRWAGPATVKAFAWWAGLGVGASRAAIADLRLVPVEEGDDRLLFPDDRDALLSQKVPREERISFVASLDNLVHLRRAVEPHLDLADAQRKVPGMTKTMSSVMDLDYHPICDRGRIVGLWDWDGVGGELVWTTFDAGAKKAVAAAAGPFAEYVEKQLGDVRSFSLDSPESRGDRIAALRAAAAGGAGKKR